MGLGFFAQASEKDFGLKDHQQYKLKQTSEQVAALQPERDCVSNAADHEAMQRCPQEMEKALKQAVTERTAQLKEEKLKYWALIDINSTE